MAGGRGFEPRLTESESVVLPLDDPPAGAAAWHPLIKGPGQRKRAEFIAWTRRFQPAFRTSGPKPGFAAKSAGSRPFPQGCRGRPMKTCPKSFILRAVPCRIGAGTVQA